jgi:predicted dehydrogenase
MAKTGPDAIAMYEAAQRTGKKLSVQMATVFSKETRTAKHLIEADALGNVYYVKTSHYRRRGRPYVDGYATPHFVQREKAGGGTLLDTAIYNMARMVYLLDNPEIETVSASTFQELDMDEGRRQEGGYDVEELGTGFVRFKGGITMFVEEAWAANMDGGEGDRIMGSKGGLKLNPFTFYTDLYDMDADVTFDIDGYERRMRSLGYTGDGYDNPQQHVVWGLLGRVDMIDTGAIGLTVARITEAMYQSAEQQKEIDLRQK